MTSSNTVCPEILRPDEDGECYNDQYPFKFKTHNGEDCCYKMPLKFRKKLLSKANEAKAVVRIGRHNFKDERRIVNKSKINVSDYDNVEKLINDNTIQCTDIFCNIYDGRLSDCKKGQENTLTAEIIKEEGINRFIPLDKDICNNISFELPSEAWLESQYTYLRSLSDLDYSYIMLYSKHGDNIINSFVRNGYVLTKDSVTYITRNYNSFKFTIEDFMNKRGEYLEDYVMEFYTSLMTSILNAPSLDKDVVFYRGISERDFFDAATVNSVYQNNGFMSTTGRTSVALNFSSEFINRIILPKGYHCLFVSNSKFLNEIEFLLPDKTKFFISKNFEKRKMFYNNQYKHFKVNEIVLINEKNIQINSKEEKKININNILDDVIPRLKIINLVKDKNIEGLKALMFKYMKEVQDVKYNDEEEEKNLNYLDIMKEDYGTNDEDIQKALFVMRIHDAYNYILSSYDGENRYDDDYYEENKDEIRNALDIKPYIEYVNNNEYTDDSVQRINVINEFDRIAKILGYPEDILSKNLKMLNLIDEHAEELSQDIKDMLFNYTKNGVNDISYDFISHILENEREANPKVYEAFWIHSFYDGLIRKGKAVDLDELEEFIEDLQEPDSYYGKKKDIYKNAIDINTYLDYVKSDEYVHSDKGYVIYTMNKINRLFGFITEKEEKILKLFEKDDIETAKVLMFDYMKKGANDIDYNYIYERLRDDNYSQNIQNMVFMHEIYDGLIRTGEKYEIEIFITNMEPPYREEEIIISYRNALDINPYLKYVISDEYVHSDKDYVIIMMNKINRIFGFITEKEKKILELFEKDDIKTAKELMFDYMKQGANDIDYNYIYERLSDDLVIMHWNYDDLIRNGKESGIEDFIGGLEPPYGEEEIIISYRNALDINPYLKYVKSDEYVHSDKDYVIEQMEKVRDFLGFPDVQQTAQVGQGRVQQYGGMWQRGGFFMTCS